MMKFSMKRVATAAMATAAVLAMSAGTAVAAPAFTIDPTVIPGRTLLTTAPFVATVFGGTSSELLHLSGITNSGFGWVQLTSASNGSTALSPLQTGLNTDYGLYLTFDLVATTLTGTNGDPGSSYVLNSLNFTVWADPGTNPFPAAQPLVTTFVQASSAGAGTEATVAGNGDDIKLAFGSIINGTANITALGGAALNAVDTFAVCNGIGTASRGGVAVTGAAAAGCTTLGSQYFALPSPFYNMALSGFNNAALSVHRNGNLVDVQDAVASITFAVPEPGSIALLGIALAGLGLSSRRNKAVKEIS